MFCSDFSIVIQLTCNGNINSSCLNFIRAATSIQPDKVGINRIFALQKQMKQWIFKQNTHYDDNQNQHN